MNIITGHEYPLDWDNKGGINNPQDICSMIYINQPHAVHCVIDNPLC